MSESIKWEIKDNTNKLKQKLESNTAVILKEWGIKWQEISTGLVTSKGVVDTGLLRDTLGYKVDVSGKKTIVGSPLNYAIYNELGTSRMPARPFIVPAIKDHGQAYASIVSKHSKI